MDKERIISFVLLSLLTVFISCNFPEKSIDSTYKDYTLGFENGEDLTGILSYNKDGGFNSQYNTSTEWIIKNDFKAHSGNRTISSIYNDSGIANDDWLVLPAMKLFSTSKLSFFAAPQYIDKSEEKIDVRISTDKNLPESFTKELLHFEFPKDTDSWKEFNADLSEYAGKTVYIAFHCTSINQYCLRIDDIKITDAEDTSVKCIKSGDFNPVKNYFEKE